MKYYIDKKEVLRPIFLIAIITSILAMIQNNTIITSKN